MAESESEIIHPINAPIFRNALKTISLPIEGGFGFNQVLSLTQTYPVLIPRLGDYAKLEVKSNNVVELYNELKKIESSVIVSKLHNYSEAQRFVSWGSLNSVTLPTRLYSVYLEALDLFLSSNRPILIKKKDSLNGFVIKSTRFNLAVKNDVRGYIESANISLSSVLVRFTKLSLDENQLHQFYVGRNSAPLMSVFAEVGFFVGNVLQFYKINLAMAEDMLDFVKKNGLGIYACYIYSVNDWVRGPIKKHELNLVVHMSEIFYSPDSIFPFYGSFTNEASFEYRSTIAENDIVSGLRELKRDTDYALKEIDRVSPIYSYQHKDGKYVFHILKPWVVFSLITAYAIDTSSRKGVAEILEADNVLEKVREVRNSSGRYTPSGNYLGDYAYRIIKDIRTLPSSQNI